MNTKEWLRFISGLIMGTTVPYIKPSIRFLWPTALQKIDDHFSLFLGGSCVCGILSSQHQCLLINTNSGAAAKQLKTYIQKDLSAKVKQVISTSDSRDFVDGNRYYSEDSQFYLPLPHEQAVQFAGEDLMLLPFQKAASNCDTAVFLKSRKTLFLGALFYNKIHPILRPSNGMNVQNWIHQLEQVMNQYKPERIIPAEGDIASPDDVFEFIAYLKILSDPKFDFSECRKRFDWIEIPGQTSLEENFELLREKTKTHTTF
jgi:hypothetical protein